MLWLVVNETETKPLKPEEGTMGASEFRTARREWIEWIQKDEAAMGSILAACEDSQHAFVLHCESSALMWAALKKVHVENQTKVNIHYYFEELFTRKYVDGASMPDHIAAMLDIKRRITQAGEDLKDIIVARAIIISLPKTQTWEFIKIGLFEVENLTSEIVGTRLMQEANRRAREKGLDESALVTMDTKTKRSNYKGRKSRRRDNRKDDRSCSCSRGSSQDGNGNRSHSHSRSRSRGPKPDDRCRYCKRKGHWANKCQRRMEDEREDNEKKGTPSANLAVENLRDLGAREVGRVFMALSGSRRPADVILDSASTSHMFSDATAFIQYTPSTLGETISVGDGHSLPVAGRGTVHFQIQLCDGEHTVVLHEVEHVPALQTNMVSLGCLEAVGATGNFSGGIIQVTMGNVALMRARLTDGLYVIDRISKDRDDDIGDGTASSGSPKTLVTRDSIFEDGIPHPLVTADGAFIDAQAKMRPGSGHQGTDSEQLECERNPRLTTTYNCAIR